MTWSSRWCDRCSFHEASSVIGGLGEVIFVFRYDEAEEDPIFMGGDYGFSLRKTSFFFFSLKKNFRCVGVWKFVCCVHAVPAEARRGRWIPWDQSYRQLWADIRVSVLNRLFFSSPPQPSSFSQELVLPFSRLFLPESITAGPLCHGRPWHCPQPPALALHRAFRWSCWSCPLALAFPCRIISDLSASFLHACVLQIVSDVLHGQWQQESIINISPLSKFYLKYNLFV